MNYLHIFNQYLYKELKTSNGSIAKAFALLMMGESDYPIWFNEPDKKVSYKEKEGARDFLLTFARAQFVEKYLSPNGFNEYLNDSIYKEQSIYNNRALDVIDVLDIPLHEYDQSGFAKGVIGYALDNCSDEELRVLFSNGIGANDLSIEMSNTIKDILIDNYEYILDELLITNIKQIVNVALLFEKDKDISDCQTALYNYALSRINPEIAGQDYHSSHLSCK